MSALGGPDPFGTAALREAVLTTWRLDPSRLRQDANLEEDHARGYYRDRVVTELAQNAADAAREAGVRGRLLLRLTTTADGAELLAANTGAPLTSEGVSALASLRASAKPASAVGRFGVGFAAVRAVSDEITVATRPGSPSDDAGAGVTFSLSRTEQLLADAAHDSEALAAVVHRREGDLPALRLPFPADDAALPQGYTTVVRLQLRGPAEVADVRSSLAQISDVLLLALPALGEVVVEIDGETRMVAGVAERWHTVHDGGPLDPVLLADRPVEERDRATWAVTWAVPIETAATKDIPASEGVPAAPSDVVHAPTPTDEPSTLPAVLIATLPLDPSRRHVATGPLTTAIVEHAGRLYGELAAQLTATGGDPLGLVPIGLPAGALDGALHTAVLDALQRTALLAEAGAGELLTARTAQALSGAVGQDPAVLTALSPAVAGLVRVPPDRTAQARRLGVELRDLGEVIEALPTAPPEPESWHALYAALEPHAGGHREALATIPVPLSDGRFARGARDLLMSVGTVPDVPGLRMVHPRAAHRLLLMLGARAAGALELLDEPALRQAVTADGASEAALALVAQAVAEHGPDAAVPAWLAELLLPSADGARLPAAELTLPGSWAARVFDALDPLAPEVVRRWGEETLRAVGVRHDLTVLPVTDVVADPDGTEETALEGWADYLAYLADELGAGAYVGEATAVADLDAVAEDAWPLVLRRIAEVPTARAALLTPVRAGDGRAPGTPAASYTAWWLREELGAPFARRGSPVAFLPEAPESVASLDEAAQAALGVVGELTELDAPGWERYVEHWPRSGDLPMAQALGLWRALARAAATGVALPAPDVVPGLDGGVARMLPATDVVVAPPMWGQVRVVLPAPADQVAELAEALDLDVPDDVAPRSPGAQRLPTPLEVPTVLPGAPSHWWECEELTVDGAAVTWWVYDGEPFATTTAGLARAFAHAAGEWSARLVLETVLTEPANFAEYLGELAGD